MLQEMVTELDLSSLDQLASVLFAIAFAGILWVVLKLRPETTEQLGSIPLMDQVVDPRVSPKKS